MSEPNIRIRPRAVAEYLRHRYRVQPGSALSIPLGQPDAGDNFRALEAWAHTAVYRHSGLAPAEQMEAIERELCNRMLKAGIVDEISDARDVPVGLVARLFDGSSSRSRRCRGRPGSNATAGSNPGNVIRFPRREDHD